MSHVNSPPERSIVRLRTHVSDCIGVESKPAEATASSALRESGAIVQAGSSAPTVFWLDFVSALRIRKNARRDMTPSKSSQKKVLNFCKNALIQRVTRAFVVHEIRVMRAFVVHKF
jgi:hypothetical protein